MKFCIECGCNMPDDHDGDMCEVCHDERGDTVADGCGVSIHEKYRRKGLEADEPCWAARCGWYDSDLGCTCSPLEMWYQCPLEPEPDWDAIMCERGYK